MSKLHIQNTLTGNKEEFKPIKENQVGMYVCGPTVYSDVHIGNVRTFMSFDVVNRYFKFLGYAVRYVRNITDVGHLENDADEGEDKIAKKAILESLEPMEVVKYYTDRYHRNMDQLNVLHPSIEPTASGHIIEQIELIKTIFENGYAYESEGSVYFDVEKYSKDYDYGKLSGRKTEDLLENTRALAGQSEKKNSFDFALWKKTDPQHLMHWPSPWSEGYPGWHLECSAMGAKYLGETFDIHGGGMDLLFPHHESEIAQSNACRGHDPVKYWMHNNMITIDGQKMGKSLNNFITLDEFFSGDQELLESSYSPMTIRFFILQAHYRSTVDFSNEALHAAEKGMQKLFNTIELLDKIKASEKSSIKVDHFETKFYEAMDDDFNTPIAISQLFELSKLINQVNDGKETISDIDLEFVKNLYDVFVFDVLGLISEVEEKGDDKLVGQLMDTILTLRQDAKQNKDWSTADKIRDELGKLNIKVKDTKDGAEWSVE